MSAAYVRNVVKEAAAKRAADRSARQAASIAFYAIPSIAPLAVPLWPSPGPCTATGRLAGDW